MPGYDTHIRTLHLGGHDYRIRSLVDLQQFADPDHHAQRIGISPVSEVLITDPGRGNSAPFTRALASQGYTCPNCAAR